MAHNVHIVRFVLARLRPLRWDWAFYHLLACVISSLYHLLACLISSLYHLLAYLISSLYHLLACLISSLYHLLAYLISSLYHLLAYLISSELHLITISAELCQQPLFIVLRSAICFSAVPLLRLPKRPLACYTRSPEVYPMYSRRASGTGSVPI